ncbi:MAG: hypothetical protein ABL857_03235 [Rickettsiales bacterium]
MRLFFFATSVFIGISGYAQAMDVDCVKKNFAEYISAKEESQKYPLQFIKDQPPEVQQAVKDEVDYQLAFMAIEKAAFTAVIKADVNLIQVSEPISSFLRPYMEQDCVKISPERCEVYTLIPHARIKKFVSGNNEFDGALKSFNTINMERMKNRDTTEKDRIKNRDVVYKRIENDMLKTDVAKVGQEIGSKTISELGCK